MCLAIPGQIISVDDADPLLRTGRVSFAGIVKEISLAMVPEARVGQYVLAHAGLAISVIDETEAAEIWRYLKEMDELEEESR